VKVINIDRDTTQAIILYYPRGCGGKFLGNVIGLSDNGVVSDYILAQMKINYELPGKHLLDILLKRLDNTTGNWYDLGMSEKAFFNISGINQLIKEKENIEVSPFLSRLIEHKFNFTLVAHSLDEVNAYLHLFQNARIIIFDQCEGFKLQYRPFYPENKITNITADFKWNANWFLNTSDLIANIERLYAEFNLRGLDVEIIKTYHKAWIECITRINDNT